MNRIIIFSAFALLALAANAFAVDHSGEAPETGETDAAVVTTCLAYDYFGRQYFWTHPNSRFAASQVMHACYVTSGAPCTPGGCYYGY